MKSIRIRLKSLFIPVVITMASLITHPFYGISWATPPVRVDHILGVVTEVRNKDISIVFESDHKPQPGDLVMYEGKGPVGYNYHSIWRVTRVHGRTVNAEEESVVGEPMSE